MSIYYIYICIYFLLSIITNMSPGMYHTCAICAPLAEVLAPVTSAFESGIGAALKSPGAFGAGRNVWQR